MPNRMLLLAACVPLGLAVAPRTSRAEMPARPDAMAWVTVPDHSKKSMAYAALELAKAARRHGMHCADVLADGILHCDIDLGAGGSFLTWPSDNGYPIRLYFGEVDSTRAKAILYAVLDDYARSMRGSKTDGEVIRCRSSVSWTHDDQGAVICEK